MKTKKPFVLARSVCMAICFLLLVAVCWSFFLVQQRSYAQVGKEVKEKIKSFVNPESVTQEELEKYQKELNAMDFKFAIPSEFQEKVNSTTLDLSKVYISPINQYENRSEWLSYSIQERVALSQVPSELLGELSTDELIVTCLNYNLLGDIGLYNSLQQGFDILKKQYNGFHELLKRKDAGSRLLALYKAIDFNELYEKDRFSSIRMNTIHMLLAEESVLRSLKDREVKDLINECYAKGKELLESKSGGFRYTAEVYVGLRCLYLHDSSIKRAIERDDSLKKFVTEGAQFISIDEIEDTTVGELSVLIQEHYLRERDRV